VRPRLRPRHPSHPAALGLSHEPPPTTAPATGDGLLRLPHYVKDGWVTTGATGGRTPTLQRHPSQDGSHLRGFSDAPADRHPSDRVLLQIGGGLGPLGTRGRPDRARPRGKKHSTSSRHRTVDLVSLNWVHPLPRRSHARGTRWAVPALRELARVQGAKRISRSVGPALSSRDDGISWYASSIE
jgi:hypothetical protein